MVETLQLAIRQEYYWSTGSAEWCAQSGEPRVPFAMLIGWIVEKMYAHGTDVTKGKELLWAMVQREHQLLCLLGTIASLQYIFF